MNLWKDLEDALEVLDKAKMLRGKYAPRSPWMDLQEHKKWSLECDKAEAHVNTLRLKLGDVVSGQASAAFVTFNCEESWRRCVEDYRNSAWALGRWMQPAALQLELSESMLNLHQNDEAGTNLSVRHSLKVEPAPAPMHVIHINLNVGECTVCLRRACVIGLIFVFLAICVVVFAAAEGAADSVDGGLQNVALCVSEVPASAIGTRLLATKSVSGAYLARIRSLEGSICNSNQSVAEVLGVADEFSNGGSYAGNGEFFFRFEFELRGQTSTDRG